MKFIVDENGTFFVETSPGVYTPVKDNDKKYIKNILTL